MTLFNNVNITLISFTLMLDKRNYEKVINKKKTLIKISIL